MTKKTKTTKTPKSSKAPRSKVTRKAAAAVKAAGETVKHPEKTKTRDPRIPAVGTVLEREYKGSTFKVQVRETDFLLLNTGAEYSSLSAIATKLADGTPKNGILWFGLTKRETKPAAAAPTTPPVTDIAPAAKRSKRHATTRKATRDPSATDAPAAAEGVDAPTPEV